ncbi:MAG: prepilin-type N-terminal cleavage/methylation domain-containing protein [Syntrophomonadaceae bacterium]
MCIVISNKRGFTLVELLVVLVLIAILALISFPQFDRVVQEYKLDTDARQLAWVLRSARQEAITSGHTQRVIFNITKGQYSKGGNRYTLSPNINFVGTTSFRLIEGVPICGFTVSGAPTPQAGAATLENKYGSQISVIVNIATGRIRVQEQL